jgi:hypothetical protein
MRILVFSDSLSLPRQTPEVCLHFETWPELLRARGHEVCLCAQGGATVRDLTKQLFYFQDSAYFDAVIVQCGIVDSAPRFARRWEVKVLQKMGGIGRKIMSMINTSSVRKFRKITYTTPKDFQQFLVKWVKSFACPVIFVEILPVSAAYEQQLPGVLYNVEKFNTLLRAHAHISMRDMPDHCIMSDHHHLNKEGHAYLAARILEKIA